MTGCAGFGPARLSDDQLGYTRALTEGQKRQILLNIVQLRFADAPVFLNTTQLISGYQLQRNVNAALNGGGSAQYAPTPTFTFRPVTGQELAQSFIRPLSPAELLPLSLSGLPIDVLFRLAVQSINGHQGSVALDTSRSNDSSAYSELLVNLRQLQIAGLLDVRLDPARTVTTPRESRIEGRLFVILNDTNDSELRAVLLRTRSLLGLRRNEREAEIVYGRRAPRAGQVAVITRPILGVLGQVGAEIQVSDDDIRRGVTFRQIGFDPIMRRPSVIIRATKQKPSNSYVEVEYRQSWYWIAEEDFDSKVAFLVVQLLLALAQTAAAPGSIVTIPAR